MDMDSFFVIGTIKISSYAHRISWFLKFGELPNPPLCILHKCDNRKCVNPDHLFIGDKKDNAVDRNQKGRGHIPKGESNGNSKLTKEQVLQIRKEYCPGSHKNGQVALAKKFGVGQRLICCIVNRIIWKHI